MDKVYYLFYFSKGPIIQQSELQSSQGRHSEI